MDEMMAAAEAIAGEGIHNAKSAVTRGFWPVSARLLRELRSGAAGAVFPRTGAERFRDNRLDGPGTSAAFGTASEAPVNLLRGARQIFCCGDGCANVVIGQHVTGTNDHENGTRCDDVLRIDTVRPSRETQREIRLFRAIPNCWISTTCVELPDRVDSLPL